jgi:hypothetical protein
VWALYLVNWFGLFIRSLIMTKKYFFRLFLSTAIISSPTYARYNSLTEPMATDDNLEFSSASKFGIKADFAPLFEIPKYEKGPLRSYIEEFNNKEICAPKRSIEISELSTPELPPEKLKESLFEERVRAPIPPSGGIHVMTDSILIDEEGEEWTIPQNRSELIAEAAKAASAAYNNEASIALTSTPTRGQFTNPARENLALTHEVVSFKAYVPGKGNVPAGIATYKEDKDGQAQIIFAFHGTESYADLVTDMRSWKQENNKILGLEGAIHGGFNESYMQCREGLIELFHAICKAHGKKSKDINVVFTGYSYGGAPAAIGGFDFKKNIAPQARVDVITFCSPRVFDAKGAAHFEEVMKDRAIRIWRANDPIPMMSLGTRIVGFLTGFKHVGQAEKLKARFDGFLPRMANHDLKHIIEDATGKEEVKTSQHEGSWDWADRKFSDLTNGVAKAAVNYKNKISDIAVRCAESIKSGISWIKSWFWNNCRP